MHTRLSRPLGVAALFLFSAFCPAHAVASSTPPASLALSREPVTAFFIAMPTVGNPAEPAFFEQERSVEAGDLWNRIRKGFSFERSGDQRRVESQAAALSSDAERFEGLTQRSSPYLYHLVEELEKRSMPMELALIPFVESSFNPLAVSSAKAAGIWQFMPATGRHFKLQQSVFKDERRGVIASTDAALTYLQYLHDLFGDWPLALAAYNWGEGNVAKAIKKSAAAGKGKSFEAASAFMPAETRAYVPKILAFKSVIATPSRFGVSLAPVENKPYFTKVSPQRDMDVEVAAKLAEIPLTEFKALNPQFDKPVIPGGSETILLPQASADTFKFNLGRWTEALSTWTAHTVTSGYEKIEALATRFKTSPDALREVNNIPPRMNVRAGSTLLVPKISAGGRNQEIQAGLVETAALFMSPQSSGKAKKRFRSRH